MIFKHVATAAAAGVVAVFAVAAPAAAATRPTLDQPTIRTRYGDITLTGKADPGSTVELWEAALKFKSGGLYQAPNYNAGGFVTAIADSNGRFEIRRTMDSGFTWAVESGGLRSNQIDVSLLSGPFRKLENRWRFIDAGHGCTRIEFDIDFLFKSRLLETLLRANFGHAVDKLIGCFEARAKTLYGTEAAAAPAPAPASAPAESPAAG